MKAIAGKRTFLPKGKFVFDDLFTVNQTGQAKLVNAANKQKTNNNNKNSTEHLLIKKSET